ncbi:hypothetical protein EV421DRAFT_544081 [Armillaria borealis]|uniref:Secreted protein n=1 Tax=Armillaria borealis TaxID=47425 RepID=A0AA39JIX9_9AGAR|nr:hypothetical protein EV421DRAFT_544081 [Armillaria borealis]
MSRFSTTSACCWWTCKVLLSRAVVTTPFSRKSYSSRYHQDPQNQLRYMSEHDSYDRPSLPTEEWTPFPIFTVHFWFVRKLATSAPQLVSAGKRTCSSMTWRYADNKPSRLRWARFESHLSLLIIWSGGCRLWCIGHCF